MSKDSPQWCVDDPVLLINAHNVIFLSPQVLSGCAIIVRGQPRGGPPPERQINLSNIRAGALARRAAQSQPDSKDIPDEVSISPERALSGHHLPLSVKTVLVLIKKLVLDQWIYEPLCKLPTFIPKSQMSLWLLLLTCFILMQKSY